MKRRGRRGANKSDRKMLDENAVRMRMATLLQCVPGNRANCEGQPLCIITLADMDGSIITLSLDLRDTKGLIIDALIALAAFENEFAKYLIDEYFRVRGPDQSEDCNSQGRFDDPHE